MKTPRIVAAVAAASLAFSSVSFAQSTGAQDQAQQRDNRGNFVRDPGPNRIDEQGRLRGPTQGIRQAEAVKAQQDRAEQRNNRRDYRADPRNDRRDYRGEGRGFDNRGAYREGFYRGQGRGAGPDHAWYRGERLPYQYRNRTYVVDDWRGHRLYAPPRGYQWVQAGGDYVLVAIATGLIASILLSQ